MEEQALTTLKIQKIALEHGMSLKDSSAYNIQFKNGHPILIDTLSFEKYVEGRTMGSIQAVLSTFLGTFGLDEHDGHSFKSTTKNLYRRLSFRSGQSAPSL